MRCCVSDCQVEINTNPGLGPRKRVRLSRNRKSFRVDFRPEIYAKLLRLAPLEWDGRREALSTVLERLILQAPELPQKIK